VAEGDRIFASHGSWMKGHPHEGDVALLEYTVSKGPELSNPVDPGARVYLAALPPLERSEVNTAFVESFGGAVRDSSGRSY
jgi:hypothetical protein